MKKVLFIVTTWSILFFALTAVQAQQLSVEQIEFGTNVENRELSGADSVFTADVGSVYCYSHITGAQDTVTITHIWYHNNEEKARVDLEIRSNNWRTWSSKTILPAWTGRWSVDILGPEGDVLSSRSFTVEAIEEQAGNR